MLHSKEYYRSFINVIDYLMPSSVWDITPEKGIELAGNYWSEIGRVLKEEHKAGWFDHGRFHITRRSTLAPIKEDCLHIIEEMEKAESDRDLANREKIENIRYGKKAYDLAEKTAKWNKRHLIVTGIVALGQIAQWIILIIRWLSKP